MLFSLMMVDFFCTRYVKSTRSRRMNPAKGEAHSLETPSDNRPMFVDYNDGGKDLFAIPSSPQSTALPLKRFLAQAPKRSLYQYNSIAEQAILVKCFQSLWHDNVDYMQKYFFPNATGDRRNLSSIIARRRQQLGAVGTTTLSGNTENVVLDEEDDGPEYWESQRGRQCGHVFKSGEAIYSCRNCAFDDTCVFCSRCFHATNHEGHDVSMSISPGAGGCCDCGDPEAWKVPVICGIHSIEAADQSDKEDDKEKSSSGTTSPGASATPRHSADSVPSDLKDSIRGTISGVLDFIIETLSTSPEEISFSRTAEEIEEEARETMIALGVLPDFSNKDDTNVNTFDRDIIEDMEDDGSIPETRHRKTPKYGQSLEDSSMREKNPLQGSISDEDDDEKEIYSLVLWNDEVHSFDDVIRIVTESIGCTAARARTIAEAVDSHGREVIMQSTNLQDLVHAAEIIASIGLAVTVRSARDVFREQVCNLLCDWMKDIVSGHYKFFQEVEDGSSIIRDIICEELCREWALKPAIAALSTRYRRKSIIDDESEGSDDDDDDGDDDAPFPGPTMMEAIIMNTADDDDEDDDNDDDTEMDMDMYELLGAEPTDLVDTHPTLARRRHFEASEESDQGTETTEETHEVRREVERKRWHERRKHGDIADLIWDLQGVMQEFQELDDQETRFSEQIGVHNMAKKKQSGELVLGSKMLTEFKKKLRLDYFMLLDLRLWKDMRMCLRKLFISTLIANLSYKRILGLRFARNYPSVADAFLLRDREFPLSVMLFSVQLLTVPTIATSLVSDYNFFGIMCSVLSSFLLTEQITLPLGDQIRELRLNCERRSFGTRKYYNNFHDLRYIINSDSVRQRIRSEPLLLRQYLDFITIFQGMNPIVRQAGSHVEYESSSWVDAFNATLQVAKSGRRFTDAFLVPNNKDNADELAPLQLIRAVMRVVKHLSDWIPPKNEVRDESTPFLQYSQLRVAGVREQEFHTVKTANCGNFSIVKFDVTKQPVSLHHPVHWLLSQLLENVNLLDEKALERAGWSGGIKAMMPKLHDTDTKFTPDDTFLTILDWPIRTMVLLCQIRSGFWVRNGYSVLNQAHHYRDVSLRENTFDTDLYLLQFGFILLDADRLFTSLLDRFSLLPWFSGKPSQSPYDSAQTIYMVEEMLSLLIVFASERSHAANLSLEEKTRREIIQNLSIAPMAHSELAKKITESMSENAKFDQILSEVAKFKAPDGLNDHGTYELKPEYYRDIDPHFWHYTRNNREDVEAELQKIWKKEQEAKGLPALADDFFIVPKLRRIESGPFVRMGNMLHSRILLQIIFYGLWNVKSSNTIVSDTIVEQVLYLAMMALVDENNDYVSPSSNTDGWDREEYGMPGFVWYASTDGFAVMANELEREHITLLRLLLRIIEDSRLSHLHKRCLWIVNHIEEKGSKEVKQLIGDWKEERSIFKANQSGSAEANNNLSEVERKKQAAKERQAKIMAQFAQAQSNFMSQNEDMYDDDDTDSDIDDEDVDAEETSGNGGVAMTEDGELEVQRKFHFPSGTCIVCQEEADSSELYGMLAFIQPSTLLRQTPLDDTTILSDIFSIDKGLDAEVSSEIPSSTSDKSPAGKKYTRPSAIHGFPPQSHKSGLHMSTCSHLMHVKCFETFYSSIEARHAAQSRYKHPENIVRREYLCPLCKALGNTLLPVVWKGKTESYPGVLAGANDEQYKSFMESGIDQLLTQLEKHRHFEPSKFIKERFWMSMASDLESRLPWSGRLSGRTSSVDESILEAMNVNVDPTDMILVKKMYSRLSYVLETIVKDMNQDTSVLLDTKLLESMDVLWGLYGYTISCIEIAQRGKPSGASSDLTVERTGTLLDSISEQTPTLLRILSETIMLYKRIFHEDQTVDSQEKEASVSVARLAQLFYGQSSVRAMLEGDRKAKNIFDSFKPLLEEEPFLILVEISMSMAPTLDLNIHHFVRQLFVAEVTKATIGLLQSLTGNEKLSEDRINQHLQFHKDKDDGIDPQTVRKFVDVVMNSLSVPNDFVERFFQQVNENALVALLRAFALPYLRRCLILLVVRHGLIIQPISESNDMVEFDRLIDCLRLPTLNEIMLEVINQPSVVKGWCQHYIDHSFGTLASIIRTNAPAYTHLTRIPIGLPTVFHLVDLPHRLDQLFEESTRRACRKCGNVPNDPALCLFCGTFVCLQGYCCIEGDQGECNQHAAICGGEVGAYIWVTRSLLLLLHNGNGCIMTAPYLDAHGEADFGFKRGRPQYLNKKRFQQYQQLWLSQSIPTHVARTIEPSHHVTDWLRL